MFFSFFVLKNRKLFLKTVTKQSLTVRLMVILISFFSLKSVFEKLLGIWQNLGTLLKFWATTYSVEKLCIMFLDKYLIGNSSNTMIINTLTHTLSKRWEKIINYYPDKLVQFAQHVANQSWCLWWKDTWKWSC